jgi:NAD+ dependent glucose-6-phosphate dehydrogenase
VKPKVGITGAEGTIGRILRKGLAGACDLVLFDRAAVGDPAGFPHTKVDLAERRNVAGLLAGLDALIHLAGDPRPNAPRAATLRDNYRATSFLLEEARSAGVRRVVFASSNFYHQGDISRALAERTAPRITLDHPPTPLCLYGESKVFGENLGRHLAHLGMSFAALRIGWAVPEDDPARYGGAYMRAVYCSHRDLVQAFAKALEAPAGFVAAFAVSNNGRGVFDLAETNRQLGFFPADDAETHFT